MIETNTPLFYKAHMQAALQGAVPAWPGFGSSTSKPFKLGGFGDGKLFGDSAGDGSGSGRSFGTTANATDGYGSGQHFYGTGGA